VNARSNDNTIPLHFACESGHLEVVRMLLNRHADVNARDKTHKTPLHWALQDVPYVS
jgi:ankyrin repeat protein